MFAYDADVERIRSWDTVDGTVDYVYSGLNIINEVNNGVLEACLCRSFECHP